jgi:membrane-associated protein
MDRRHFFLWSGVGALLWATGITLLGYFLGQAFPALKENLELAILLIVAVSVVPMAVEFLRARSAARTALEETEEALEDLVDGRD